MGSAVGNEGVTYPSMYEVQSTGNVGDTTAPRVPEDSTPSGLIQGL